MSRFLDWALEVQPDVLPVEVVRLVSITLFWFLTASNRFVRDRATKGLTTLIRFHPHLMVEIMEKSRDINDPYVKERVYAAAYGVAMLTRNGNTLRTLARAVYDGVFSVPSVPCHILLRDYARGVLERALNRGALPEGIDIVRAIPPYESEWLTQIPDAQQVETLCKIPEHPKDNEFGLMELCESVMEFGDFARYIIGTNTDGIGIGVFSSERLQENGRSVNDSDAQSQSREQSFELSIAQRWILSRVIELGWTVELFGEFDRELIFR